MLRDLAARWLSKAETLDRYAPLVSEAFRECARELEAETRSGGENVVTLGEASAIGGYSADHLQRLVAKGALENVGQKYRPRIRRADVPVKPGHSLRPLQTDSQLDSRRRIVASARDSHSGRA
jgi:hypothetical protein